MKKALIILGMTMGTFAYAQGPQRAVQSTVHPTFVNIDKDLTKLNVQQIFNSVYQLGTSDALVLVEEITDDLGQKHQKYQQLFNSIPVEGAVVSVHIKNNVPELISGYFAEIDQININPQLTKNAGFNIAKQPSGATSFAWDEGPSAHLDVEKPTGDLVIITDPKGFEAPRLAYRYDIYALAPLYRAEVYVDAINGQILRENHRIHDVDVAATGTSLYNGNVSFTADNTGGTHSLRQTTNGNGIETYTLNNGTNYGNAADVTSGSSHFTGDKTAVQAHWGAEKTHDYFSQKHGRNSYDGSGAVIKSYVHYSNGYVNAFWDGARMTYGDGDGISTDALVSLDIVGHEIAHGVTEYAANLVYSYESGALNESFSDIFGEAIEKFAKGTNDWQMGTDIGIGGSGAIRSMNNPNAYNNPDTYNGTHWYTGSGDNGGVHINSGVQNKWFYILSQGETGTNDIGNSYNVTGIGMDKAALIAYRNLTVYLNANSQYVDARSGAIQSAIDLYGAGSAEVIATTNAWYAVGVGGLYGTISYCTSTSSSSSYEWIAGVSLGSFNNASGSSNYTDFTGSTINVTAGQSYGFTLTPGYSGSAYGEYWKVWIDYNADGDFSDAGELAYDAGSPQTTAQSGTIVIPSTATPGSTRMRVSMKWNAGATPCENFSYGEVEDYTLAISTGSPGDVTAPSVPAALSANNTTQTTTDLTWTASTDNVGVDHYNIYVGGSLNGTSQTTNYSVSGLTANTTYTITVEAEDAAGNISGAASVSVTTLQAPDVIAPTTPGSLAASNITQTSTDISWSQSTDNVGVDHYNVYVGSSLIGVSTVNTAYIITGLTASTTYSISVEAEDAAGNKSPAAVISVTTLTPPDVTAPSIPGSLTSSNTTQSSTELSWSASTDNVGVTHYNVYNGTSLLGTTSNLNYAVAGLIDNTVYNFAVEAEDAAGNVSSSASISVTTLPAPDVTAPSTPTVLMVSNVSQTSVDVSWAPSTDNVGVAKYNVFVNGVLEGSSLTTNYSIAGLTANSAYSITVNAQDAAGNTSGTGVISFTTLAVPDVIAPTAPSNLAANNTTVSSTTISWTASTDNVGVNHYKVYQNGALVATTANTSYLASGLTPTTSYSFWVEAEDLAGNATASSTISVTTLTPPDVTAPSTPGSIAANNTTVNSTTITWSASTDNIAVDHYNIYMNGTVVGSTSNTSYLASGLTPSTSYSFSVEAEDAAGNISGAANVSVTTLTPADVTSPSVPGNLTASNTTYYSTDLSWYASTDNVGVTQYNIYANGTLLTSVSGLTYTASGLQEATTYNFTVTAEDAAGNVSGLASASTTTGVAPDVSAPSIPGSLNASGTTETSTTLIWNASSDNVGVDHYSIYINGSLNGTTNGTQYTVNGLVGATTYTMSVEAEDAAGNVSSAASINVTTVTPPDTKAPTAPSGLTANNTTQTSTDLNWGSSTDNVGVAFYSVYVNGNFEATTTGNSMNISGLTAGTTYTMSVEAEDAAGNVSSSTSTTVATLAVPSNTTLFASYFETGMDNWTDGGSDCSRYKGSKSYEGEYSIRLRDNSKDKSSMWSPSYDVSAYNQLDINFHFYPTSMDKSEDFFVLFYDGSSWVKVATFVNKVDFVNNSFYSATVTINSSFINFPTNAQFKFQCDAGSNSDQIYIDAVDVVASNVTSFINPSAPSTNTKELYALATSDFGDVVEEEEGEEVILYPNPTRESINIDTEFEVSQFAISSMNGTVVRIVDNPTSLKNIDVSDLPEGAYFITLITDDEIQVKKFIKL